MIIDEQVLEGLAKFIAAIEEAMSDEQRLQFWEKIKEGFCPHCGRKEQGYKCQCWNDE